MNKQQKKPPTKPADRTWTSVWTPVPLKKKLRMRAAELETSVSQLVVDILTRELG